VKDAKTGTCYRADKLIQDFVEKTKNKKKNLKEAEIAELDKLSREVEQMDGKEIDDVIIKFGIKAPDTNNELLPSYKFNLMFNTPIGPQGNLNGFLRPETAQGHFVNFRKLLEFNGGKVPFASGSIGLGFRNEISPRSGLLRVREFTMAEIEHYIDPLNKNHKKFNYIKDMKLPLWTAGDQKEGKGVITDLTLEKAVEEKIINNQTLAYFLARTYLFLTRIGIQPDGLRFRQHTEKEMAHYAADCWDAEIETSYGWIECAGHADRHCYDLSAHSKASGVELCAARILSQPIMKKVIKVLLNKVLNNEFI
jgi:glycyl-tRNA synthetase